LKVSSTKRRRQRIPTRFTQLMIVDAVDAHKASRRRRKAAPLLWAMSPCYCQPPPGNRP